MAHGTILSNFTCLPVLVSFFSGMGREESVSWISSGHEHLLLSLPVSCRLHDEDAVLFAVLLCPRLCFSFQSTLFLGSSVAVEENKRQAQVSMVKLDNKL